MPMPDAKPPQKADLLIDRIVLHAGDMEPRVARRLAEQVAAELERSTLAGDLPQRGELVRLQVRPAPGASLDQLSQLIVAELMRELHRS
jgi:hypothetical protein